MVIHIDGASGSEDDDGMNTQKYNKWELQKMHVTGIGVNLGSCR